MTLPDREFSNRRASVAADLGGIAAGEYLLTFDASVPDQTSSRTVRFAVR